MDSGFRRNDGGFPLSRDFFNSPLQGGFFPPGRRADGTGMDEEMKIIIFSIKLDKFTGFFDKFLKGIRLVTDCNIMIFLTNLSVAHSDSGPKKVFRLPRISPQPPAFARYASPPREPNRETRRRPGAGADRRNRVTARARRGWYKMQIIIPAKFDKYR